MKIERLNVGWFIAPAGIFRTGDDMDKLVRYPVSAYLIETPKERILVDTGLNPAAISNPAAYYDRPDIFSVVSLEQEESIKDQVDLGSLTKLVITHLHWDHIGGLDLIPASVPAVIQRKELRAGHDQGAIARNSFLPRDYADTSRDMILVDGDHDLLGDGSIELLLTPGHTPGHQSIRIGKLVLGIDVSHFASGLVDHRFPVFADDHREQKRSAERLRKMRDDGYTVIPGHDPDLMLPGPVTA